jgi:hypothetical protein
MRCGVYVNFFFLILELVVGAAGCAAVCARGEADKGQCARTPRSAWYYMYMYVYIYIYIIHNLEVLGTVPAHAFVDVCAQMLHRERMTEKGAAAVRGGVAGV